MKIIIVRHGQTRENLERLIQVSESSLTELGQQQTEQLAGRLKGEKIDIAYVSDLLRTRQTADYILPFHPQAEVVYTKELREKDAGTFKGKHLDEQRAAIEKSGVSFYDFTPPEGESLVDLQARVVKFYKALTEQSRDKTILLVTHNGVIKTLLLYLAQKTFNDYVTIEVPNTAVTVIEVDSSGKHAIHTLSDAGHLN